MLKGFMKNYRKTKRTINKINKIAKQFDKSKTTTKRGNPPTNFFNRNKQYTLNEIDEMTGVEFELFCSNLFEKQGYKSSTTKTSGDYGADLVLNKNRNKIVVQVKRSKSNIGVSAVQEIVSAVAYYKANQSWVITNAYFTPAAKNLAKVNNVRLIDRDELIRMI